MIAGLLLFLPLTAALLILELQLSRATHGNAIQDWLALHLYLPLMRATALLVFVFIAYPGLYGLATAPSISALLTAGHYRFDQLVNVLLLVSLLLPLVPVLNRLTGVTLALQGMCATALLASWVAIEAGATVRFLPDLWLVFRIAAVLLAARLAGQLLAKEFLRSPRYRELLVESLRMLAQLPAVIMYAHFLGTQLSH